VIEIRLKKGKENHLFNLSTTFEIGREADWFCGVFLLLVEEAGSTGNAYPACTGLATASASKKQYGITRNKSDPQIPCSLFNC
jgi:hypothetical protein